MSRQRCLIGLGSNLGDRAAHLREAFARLATLPQTVLASQSALYATAPVGGPSGQGKFQNAAALLETTLPPRDMLAALQNIETELGRVRGPRWGPRTIDLDLLLHGNEISTTPELTLPQPRMAFRRFVLAPAVEIAPDMLHPEIGWTVRQLWEHLNAAPQSIALAGGPLDARRALAERVAAQSTVTVESDWSSTAAAIRFLVRLDDIPLAAHYAGPVLKVDPRDLVSAAAEIVAAVEAMR